MEPIRQHETKADFAKRIVENNLPFGQILPVLLSGCSIDCDVVIELAKLDASDLLTEIAEFVDEREFGITDIDGTYFHDSIGYRCGCYALNGQLELADTLFGNALSGIENLVSGFDDEVRNMYDQINFNRNEQDSYQFMVENANSIKIVLWFTDNDICDILEEGDEEFFRGVVNDSAAN